MEPSSPQIDKRSFKDLLKQARSMAPFYTPEWDAMHEKEPGAALLKIFFHMFEQILNRLNKVPDKNQLAFLDMMGIKMHPAQPAHASITFSLAEGTKQNVLVPKGTQLTGEGKQPTGESEEVIFQTRENLLVSPALLQEVISVDPAGDSIYSHTEDFNNKKGFTILKGTNKQEHALFIAHNDLLNQKEPSEINVNFTIAEKATGTGQLAFVWEYWNGDQWVEFSTLKKDGDTGNTDSNLDNTDKFIRSGVMNLEKNHSGEIKSKEVNGIENRWIRCRIQNSVSSTLPVKFPDINTIHLSVSPKKDQPLKPELAFNNDIPIDLETDVAEDKFIKPFGKMPRLFDTFYIACDEAFSKKGATITLQIDAFLQDFDGVNPPLRAPTAILSWEYWTGRGWQGLNIVPDNASYKFKDATVVSFPCPDDIKKAKVNGEEKYWIRVRIIDGDYGKEVILENIDIDGTDELKATEGNIYHPEIKELTITYEAKEQPIENCITYNNFDYVDRSIDCRNSNKVFKPFGLLPEKNDSLFLGFNRPLIGGPLSILFSLEEQGLPQEEKVKLEWHYWDGSAWIKFNVKDGTENLTKIGMLRWIGSRNAKIKDMFDKKLFWLKGSIVEGSHSEPPEISGIFPNTTNAIQSTVIENEVLGSSDATLNQEFSLLNPLIIYQKIQVREPELPDKEQQKAIRKSEGDNAVKIIYDDKKEIKEIWITWSEMDDFDNSGPMDRHYTVNRRTGNIRFGDGENGIVPPIGNDNIKADYRFGGGKIGNVPKGAVTGLIDAVPFVEQVVNNLAADGGSETETIEEVIQRGPQCLKNRDRAVTTEDFEWMARDASRKVMRAKCLPNTDENREEAPGWVTVLIVPDSDEKKTDPSKQLINVVTEGLKKSCVNIVAFPGNIHVAGPDYVEVTVEATVIPKIFEDAATTENNIIEKLNYYIHPLTGGPDEKGWEFGKMICIPELYALIEGVEGVDHVEGLVLLADGNKYEKDLSLGIYTLPFSGDHKINIKMQEDEILFLSPENKPRVGDTGCC